MKRKGILISNNCSADQLWSNSLIVDVVANDSSLAVLQKAKEYIHKGHLLFSNSVIFGSNTSGDNYCYVVVSQFRVYRTDYLSLYEIEQEIARLSEI